MSKRKVKRQRRKKKVIVAALSTEMLVPAPTSSPAITDSQPCSHCEVSTPAWLSLSLVHRRIVLSEEASYRQLNLASSQCKPFQPARRIMSRRAKSTQTPLCSLYNGPAHDHGSQALKQPLFHRDRLFRLQRLRIELNNVAAHSSLFFFLVCLFWPLGRWASTDLTAPMALAYEGGMLLEPIDLCCAVALALCSPFFFFLFCLQRLVDSNCICKRKSLRQSSPLFAVAL